MDGRSPGAAADFEHFACGLHLKLIGESKPLFRRHPTALPNILAVGAAPDGRLRRALVVSVDVVVQIDGLGHVVYFRTSWRSATIPIVSVQSRLSCRRYERASGSR